MVQLYIEALLADETLAEEVWLLRDRGMISDDLAAWAWLLVLRLSVGP
jgi:hypothetical protein